MINVTMEQIRKDKGITIDNLAKNVFSRVTYDNFKKGKHDIKLNSFLLLMNNLHLLPEEMIILTDESSKDSLKNILKSLRILTVNHDVRGMEKLRRDLLKSKRFYSNHISELIDLRIIRETRNIDLCLIQKDSIIIKYLMSTEKWTRYEIILFTNAMFIFDSELIDISLNRVFKTIKNTENIQPYGEEKFRILLDAYIVFFEREDYRYILKWKKFLESYQLSPVFFFEKTMQTVFSLFIKYIEIKNAKYLEEVYSITIMLSKINCEEYSKIIMDMNSFIKEVY